MTEPTNPSTPTPKPRQQRTSPPEGNGIAPAVDDVESGAARSADAPAAPAASPATPAPAPALEPAPSPPPDAPKEMILALSPKQIIGGFALLAGLIILARRRGRKG